MGVLTRAGVPILNTISITAQISGNVLYKAMWLAVYEEVRQGKKIASSLLRSNLMPSNVVQMIRSGEDAGNLSDVLRDISSFYARELKTIIKTVTSMIEPAMIVAMGFLVGFYRHEHYSADIQDVQSGHGQINEIRNSKLKI